MQATMSRSLPPFELDRRAISVWRLANLTGVGVLTIIALVVAIFGPRLFGWPQGWALLPLVVIVVIGLPLALIQPVVSFRRWRWNISEDEVETLSGVIVTTRRLIPMARIQHVDTTRGVVERALGLATVVVYTAAGSSRIPVLSVEQANALRDRIAALSNTYDDI